MTPERVHQLFESMRDRGAGGIAPLVQAAVRDTMVGRSLDAMLPLLETAHDRLAMAPGMAADLPDGGRAGVSSAPEGRYGGVWRKVIVLERERAVTLVCLHLGGEPNPEADRALAKVRGVAMAPPGMVHQPGPAVAVQVYQARHTDDLWPILASDAAGKWNASQIMTAERADRSDAGAWDPQVKGGASGQGLALWPEFFLELGRLFEALGLGEELRSAQATMSAREWMVRDEELPRYLAARAMGSETAREDGFLPGSHCLAALEVLERLMTVDAMRFIMPSVRVLSDLIEQGRAAAYGCHEGRNAVRLGEDGLGGYLLMETRENIDFSLRPTPTGVALIATLGGNLAMQPRACLVLQFHETDAGGWEQEGRIGQDVDAIRAWNAFHDGILTVGSCAVEEAGMPSPAASPAPAGSAARSAD